MTLPPLKRFGCCCAAPEGGANMWLGMYLWGAALEGTHPCAWGVLGVCLGCASRGAWLEGRCWGGPVIVPELNACYAAAMGCGPVGWCVPVVLLLQAAHGWRPALLHAYPPTVTTVGHSGTTPRRCRTGPHLHTAVAAADAQRQHRAAPASSSSRAYAQQQQQHNPTPGSSNSSARRSQHTPPPPPGPPHAPRCPHRPRARAAN